MRRGGTISELLDCSREYFSRMDSARLVLGADLVLYESTATESNRDRSEFSGTAACSGLGAGLAAQIATAPPPRAAPTFRLRYGTLTA